MRITRRTFATGLAGWASQGSWAQPAGSPSGVRSLLVPFSPGVTADVLARKYTSLVAESDGTPFIVENAPGAGGVIAARQLLKRRADGRNFIWAHSGLICNAWPLAKGSLEFDPASELTPVSVFVYTPFVLFAAKDFPADDLASLATYAKGSRAPLTCTPGDLGSANHLAMELLLQRMEIPALGVPYRNFQNAFIDIAERRVDFGVFAWTMVAPLVQADRVKILAVLADKPISVDPRHRTVSQQGFGRFDLQGWIGVFAAKGTPAAAIADLERQTETVLNRKGLAEFIVSAGQEAAFRGAADSRVFVAAEVERSRALLQKLRLV